MTSLPAVGLKLFGLMLPRWRKIRTPLLWALAIAYFVFAGIFLTLRYAILPHIADYRQDLEQALSSALHQPVSIAAIEADWRGLRPHLTLHGLQLSDQAGRPALGFDKVDAILGWESLLYLDVRMHRLEVDAPALSMRREADGQIFIAGLPLNTDSEDGRFGEWLLAQGQIVINNATISWHDAKREAPPLVMNKVNFNLQNSGSRHRFALTAEPPPDLAARLDIRGDFKGRDLNALDAWKGQIYTELDYADLAVWRQWVDYPVDLPRGSGGLRLWLNFADKKVTGATVDLALAKLDLRLKKNLPMLSLEHLRGRLVASEKDGTYAFDAQELSLTTRDGLVFPSTNFHFAIRENDVGEPVFLETQANTLNLSRLTTLSAYLPLPAGPRDTLAQIQPSGEVRNLSLRWEAGRQSTYTFKGELRDVGMAADGNRPGVRNLSANIEGNEKGGSLKIRSRQIALDLPAIFPEPRIHLEKLDAKVHWENSNGIHHVTIDELQFANHDAEGSVKGTYSTKPDGMGNIDLGAQLTRANATSVWRYLPLVVGKDAREWVKQGVVGGHSNDVKLTLKGDLDHFPFRDGSGTFKVLIKAEDASINPATGWPLIENIKGEVAFIAERLEINAKSGQILGVPLSDVRVALADLESTTDQTLVITGKGKGATQDFLKFIEASPVGARINHFTAPMSATGEGELDLKLQLTLHDIDKSSVHGSYRFDNNRLLIDTSVPPLTEAQGTLDFTGDGITVRDARVNLLGSPATVNISTASDGQIDVRAEGQISVAALRKQQPIALFDQMTGGSRWKGHIAIRKSDVDIKINSDLTGLSSSLPEPFNKSATSAMDFRFERKMLPPEGPRNKKNADAPRREQTELVLGKALRAQLLRPVGSADFQRGLLQVGRGEALRTPDKGVLLSANLAKIDIDFWRRMFATPVTAASKTKSTSSSLPFTQVDLRSDALIFMNRTVDDVKLTAQQSNRNWKAELRSKAVNATLDWQPGADGKPGKLSGHISQLLIPDPNQEVAQIAEMSSDPVSELPALAITLDRLSIRGHEWGSASLDAENRNGYWHTKFSINNEDGSLSGDGKWQPDSERQDTQLNFQLKAKSIERLLARAGYPDAVRRGTATIDGSLAWNGSPFSMDYPSLGGKVKLDVQNGQFKKLEPGIGRLLGVLSLQSLPRRINLDFRDIFSEGFAFDSIRGEASITQGLIHTDELTINGPAAKVRMNGNINLPQETQNLHVRVQPALGETLAVGAMLANPAVGAVAWLTHKVLRDPIDQLFAFEYQVTGKWDDPKVAKIDTGRDINQEISRELQKNSPQKDGNKEVPQEPGKP